LNDGTPLFTIQTQQSTNEIAGDVGHVSPDQGAWNNECYTTVMKEGIPVRFEWTSSDGPFLDALTRYLTKLKITQGYLHCEDGFLSNIHCGFFMTTHRPTAQFAEAEFKNQYRILNISGFFLTLPSATAQATLVPHLHITCQRSDQGSRGTILGGHLMDAVTGHIQGNIVPLMGIPLTRETNPASGVMHIRSDDRDPPQRSDGDIMVFALPPDDEFPSGLVDALSDSNLKAGQLRFAVGTLWDATVLSDTGQQVLHPPDGLEVTFATGQPVQRSATDPPSVVVRLLDRYGRYTEGVLVRGRVKDLVEGVVTIV
jgi:predicted DNA-binding protein with PD1-like motif